MRGRWRLVVPALLVCALAAEDAVVTAATAALAQGRPAQALDLLGVEGGGAAAQALRVQAAAALGDVARTQAFAGADLSRWPVQQRGAVALAVGRMQAAAGDWPAARSSLLVAIDSGGVEGDHALDLLAEVAFTVGDLVLARRCAELRWRRMPRTAAAAGAGLLLARLHLESDPVAARVLLAQVRALPDLPQGTDDSAVALLCRSFLAQNPEEALMVAERALANGARGDIPLWRALALLAIDPAAGTTAVARLPADLAVRPEIAAVRASAAPLSDDRQRRLALAQAASAGRRWAEVVDLATPLAADDAVALSLVLAVPGADPARWSAAPAARTPIGASALAQAWLARANPAAALAAVLPVLEERREFASIPRYWAWRSALALGDVRADGWARDLRQIPPEDLPDLIAGEVWADFAQAVGRGEGGVPPGDRQAEAAWLIAARRLPVTHPWWLPALEMTLRAALDQRLEADSALSVAERLGRDLSLKNAQICAFFAVQVAVRAGHAERAESFAGALRRVASPEQLEKLERLLSRGEIAPTPSPR